MNCKGCGAILDSSGDHTDEFSTSWVIDGKTKRSKLYRVWANMKDRCQNPRQPRYKDYGARGIFVCDEWQIFSDFRLWAIKSGWSPALTIDRKNNDDGYYPENCRFTEWNDQQQNRRLPSRHKTGKRYACRQLTPDDIYFIRESSMINARLAEMFDVHDGTISKIKRRLTWTQLPEREPDETRL